jgi:VCBS repeat-containing protein
MFASNAAQVADHPQARSGSGGGASGAWRRPGRVGALSGAAVLLAVLALALPAGALGQATFRHVANYPTGYAAAVAAGDFSGDGDPDLAVANYTTNNVSVLTGRNIGGTFGAATDYPVHGNPVSVAVGNFNGDSRTDMVVANYFSDNVSVLLARPVMGGGFEAAKSFPAGDQPSSVAVGDLNGDDDPDLAVANYDSDSVSVLLGDGAGGFTAAPNSPIAVGDGPKSVAIGQFNPAWQGGDTHADLAVANSMSDDVSVLYGDGSGSFAAATTPYDVGHTPVSVAVGDFDGNSRPDLAVANADSNNVSLLLGGAGGQFFSFGSATTVAVCCDPYSVAVGNFDRDSDPDLAVANMDSDNVSVLLGGTGYSFGSAINVGSGDTPYSVAVGNFDHDNDDDLAVANYFANNVTVSTSNNPPDTLADAYSTDEDEPLTVAAPGVLANDSDWDGDDRTATRASGPSHGTVTLDSNGSFTYTPDRDFNGTDSFTYRASDGELDSEPTTVTIEVKPTPDNPRAAGDQYQVDEDMELGTLSSGANGVLRNDTDPDGDGLTAELVAGPQHGSLRTFNENGSFLYVPDRDFNGTDSFSYRASDGSLESAPATVTITVRSRNDRPRAVEDSYTVDEDGALNVGGAGVLANDSDVDGDSLKAVPDPDISCCPRHGSVTLNPDGSFVYTPDPNFNGTDTFYYRADDGSPDPDLAMVTIRVNAVNDAPVATDDTFATDEDTPLTIAAAGVLGNDSDADRDRLTAALASDPANGSVTVDPDDGSLTYTPEADFNGTDSFTYTAGDGAEAGTATVTIEVRSVADFPVANDDAYETDEDTPLTVGAPGVLANDSDGDGDGLKALRVLDFPDRGDLRLNDDGSFTYTPSADSSGRDSFHYLARDPSGRESRTATVRFDVKAVNDAPAATGDAYTTDEDTLLAIDPRRGVLANDGDTEGAPLAAVLVSGPRHGSLELREDGSLSYGPKRDYNGTDSFVYRANDGNLDSDPVTVTVDVNAIEDAPAATGDAYATGEDSPLSVTAAEGVLANDGDPDGDPLTAALVSGPSHGGLELNADGSFSYTPNPDYNGTDSFSYQANDGGLYSDLVTVTIDVTPVDDTAPAGPAQPPADTGSAPPAGSAAPAQPTTAQLRLAKRCVRPSRSGRVRIRMSLRMARPGPLQIRVDRAVGGGVPRSCPSANPQHRFSGRFRTVATLDEPVGRPAATAAAVTRRLTLRMRLSPGLYRISVRAKLDGNRLSRPLRRYLRVLG